MGRYSIVFTKHAAKQYARIPSNYRKLIDTLLSKLKDGLTGDIRPVHGSSDTYRLRIGRYRILFILIKDVILIAKIGTRGDIYHT